MHYKGLELDRFQTQAIDAIDRDNTVVVTAPTGAGKTVIAEYAVEKCLKENLRVIYTAPIKALSNQKYREFYAEYGDKIGIVTGDVVLNPYAQVLLMTTEIFRNTIFDDIERLRDVSYVVFDEIHYINDIERGTVWEESIIFAPQHIKFVCLSATIPNIDSFSKWMQSVREINIEVVEELKRPVPLEHSLYFKGYGVGKLAHLPSLRRHFGRRGQKRRSVKDSANVKPRKAKGVIRTELIPYLHQKKQLPCLYFCFSRKGCEINARYYAELPQCELLQDEQQAEILEKFDALCLQFDIAEQKTIRNFRELIRKGIAYHHAGMLPTLKEVVEQLFTSGLIQLLFTTETFAVGINMPACSVVFDSLEKFDGVGFRYLKAREYHQMAGRAGRRGIDTVGYVYAQVDQRYAVVDDVRKATSKKIEPITSQFNLSYASILNLYEKYGEDIYGVYTMSLSNYQNYKRIAELGQQIEVLEEKRDSLPLPQCIHDTIDGMQQITEYHMFKVEIRKKIEQLHRQTDLLRFEMPRGKSKRKEQNKKISQIHAEIKQLNTEPDAHLCHKCHKRKQCTSRYQAIRRPGKQIQNIKKRQENIENYQRNQIAARLKVLETLGYIEGQTLLPRGKTAGHIYGHELQLTQLLLSGFFERLTEDEINCLIVAIVTEHRKDSFSKKLTDDRLLGILEAAWNEIVGIQQVERRFKVAEITPLLEPQLCAAMLAWSRGCEFDTLTDYATLDAGDFVRIFRLVIDQLRQIRRAMKGHTALVEKLNRCIGKINRDVIDAERQLRIGQENMLESDNNKAQNRPTEIATEPS